MGRVLRFTLISAWLLPGFGFTARTSSSTGAPQFSCNSVDSLIKLSASGDSKALDGLKRLIRQYSIGGETSGHDADCLRAIARGALALGKHISDPDSVLVGDEREWRSEAVRALWRAIAMEPRDTWSMERLEDLAPYPHIWKSPEEELAILSAAS